MRRRAVAESIVHGRELGLDVFLAQTNHLKCLDHDLRVMIPNGTGGKLHTVANQVILESSDFQGINLTRCGFVQNVKAAVRH